MWIWVYQILLHFIFLPLYIQLIIFSLIGKVNGNCLDISNHAGYALFCNDVDSIWRDKRIVVVQQ